LIYEFLSHFVTKLFVVAFIIDHRRLGLVWIFHRFERPFVPKSCVQGLYVAAEKKRGRKNKKTEEVPAVQKKILLLKKKLLLKQKKEREKKRERSKK
jgi:polyferredoxin